jgi:hypothetical protein
VGPGTVSAPLLEEAAINEQKLLAILKEALAGVEGVEGVYDWPWDAEDKFYIEAADSEGAHARFRIEVRELPTRKAPPQGSTSRGACALRVPQRNARWAAIRHINKKGT